MANSQFEHMHVQAVALPAALAGGCKEHFERHGARVGVSFETLPAGSSLDAAMATAEPFFRVELPSGEHLLHRMANNSRKHPLQFGREVVANILGKPELKDWKRCLPKSTAERQGTEEQLEALMANEFKAAFAPFDPMR